MFQQERRTTLRQMVLILVLAAVVGGGTNMIRPDGIPFVGDWSIQGRLAADNGETLVVPFSQAQALYENNGALFLDARAPEVFDLGHIKGAKNLPWHGVDEYFMDVVQGVASETVLITYCDGESCNLSHDLALFLKEMGFPNAKVLVNGWTVWQDEGLPVEGLWGNSK